MQTPVALLTADQLFRMPDDGYCHELVEGRLTTVSPPGFVHGICGGRLIAALERHVREQGLGYVAQDTGFTLRTDPDTVRAPDVAFVAAARIPRGDLPLKYWPGAPDLAVEVLSPRERGIDRKIEDYLTSGARAVWIVRPRDRTVTVHHPAAPPRVFQEDELLEDPQVMPGFRYPLRDLFENLPRR